MKTILERVKDDLLRPSKNTLKYLVVALNIVYILSTIFFLTSEKIAEGRFVPRTELFYLAFLPALLSNFLSLAYHTIGIMIGHRLEVLQVKWIEVFYVENPNRFHRIFSWISVISVMFMSFVHINGIWNPSTDAIITDYALAHSLIVVGVIILGRKGATIWSLIVIGTLVYNVNKMGWDYKFHYLTPSEAEKYEVALENGETWALKRKEELRTNGLNPPKISRYFNTWLIFIIVAYFGAYFYSGITTDILRMLPSVIKKIEKGIQESVNVKSTLKQQQKEATLTAMRIYRNADLLDKIRIEFDKFDHKEKGKFQPIIHLIKNELSIQGDWSKFKANFDSVHSRFFEYLDKNYPELSDTDKMHLSYIKMGFKNLYIAQLMNVKLESLRKLRYRLRIKLGLERNQDLSDFLKNIIV